MDVNDITRPDRALTDRLAAIGSATTSAELSKMGLRNCHIVGPTALKLGYSVAGPALTLQMVPKREDLFSGGEYEAPELQLHRHVMYPAQPGDIIVVDARGNMESGIFGEMMLTYFAGRGGRGVIVDGCIRDSAKARELDLGVWVRGATPNYHAQTGLIPWGVNVPVACGGTFVMPGDIIVADDDGAVVVPIALAEKVADVAGEHADWEEFSRLRLSEGGDLRTYYPLADEAWDEYRAWRAAQDAATRSR